MRQAEIIPAAGAPGSVLADAYTAYCRFIDASERTERAYTSNVRQFINWTHSQDIQQPARDDILAWRDYLRTRCRPSTVQAYITAVRLFFRWTEQQGIYPNIADHVKGARLDAGHKKDYLTAEQIKILLGSIETDTAKGRRDYAILALMVTGGLRDIEVSRANMEDLRQLGGATVLYTQGKGHEERTEFIKVVPAVEKALRDYLRTRRRSRSGEKDPLFVSLSNNSRGQRLSPKSISTIVKERLRAAGYDSDRITAHSLRHTAVTLALLGDIPLEEVQQFARHKNISTTQIYAHNLDRAANRSADTIADSIFK